MKKLIIGSLVVVALGSASLAANARTSVDFYVNVAPPVAPYEYVPAPRVGWVWVPGAWTWRYNRYHWAPGYWVRERPGYYYAPTRWVERGGRWHHHHGGWHHGGWRDSDHDGVPDRYDAAPYDPRWR